MTDSVGDKKFGVVSYVIVRVGVVGGEVVRVEGGGSLRAFTPRNVWYFSTPRNEISLVF
jgi:hypothetical protein